MNKTVLNETVSPFFFVFFFFEQVEVLLNFFQTKNEGEFHKWLSSQETEKTLQIHWVNLDRRQNRHHHHWTAAKERNPHSFPEGTTRRGRNKTGLERKQREFSQTG